MVTLKSAIEHLDRMSSSLKIVADWGLTDSANLQFQMLVAIHTTNVLLAQLTVAILEKEHGKISN